jgi:hypothetical protein
MSRYCIQATWNDAVHLTEVQKDTLYASIPNYQRDARTKGIPQLGSGAIYPVPESEIICDPFVIPKFWPRCYALDVGWNRTACLWGAWDRDNDIVYLYSEYYRGQAEPAIHAQAIRSRGAWIPGVIDPAARGRQQSDGEKLADQYIDLGLSLGLAENAVEAGIYEVWSRLSTGRLKVFVGLQNFLTEFRLYRRDEKGKIVKENDHLCDCARYLLLTGLLVAEPTPPDRGWRDDDDVAYADSTRSDVTGY